MKEIPAPNAKPSIDNCTPAPYAEPLWDNFPPFPRKPEEPGVYKEAQPSILAAAMHADTLTVGTIE